MVDKWEKGRWSKYFNERAKPPAEKLLDKGGHSGQGARPPTHGLQGRPPPPGYVAGRSGSFGRMREQEMANRKKQIDLSKEWDEQNKAGNRGKGEDGRGKNGKDPEKNGPGGGR